MKTSEKMEKIEEYLAGEKIDPAWRDMILEYKAYLSRQVHHTTDAEKEYIERGEAKRVMETNDWLNPAIPNVVNVILDRLAAADVVEVVRCKDCKHMIPQSHTRYCTIWHGANGMGDEGFCSYGERKKEK